MASSESQPVDKEEEIEYPYEFDQEKRKKAKVYSKQKLYTGLVQGTFLTILVLAVFYFSSASMYLHRIITQALSNTPLDHHWLVAALFIMAFMGLTFLIGIPLSYYSGFVLEHKYGLSNQDLKGWLKDTVKSFIISILFTTPLILGLFYLGTNFPEMWWLYAGALYFAVMGVLANISHLILIPLFYETEELKDEYLKEKLLELARENGVPEIKKVIVVKAGEKTEKANAGFAGMGKTKRLLIFDTLLDKFHPDEVESVVAHEMGHYVNKDMFRLMLINGLLIFPMLYISGSIFTRFASFDQIYHLPLFLLIVYGLYEVVDPFILAYGRRRERKADSFALKAVGTSEQVISTFKRLSDIDLAEVEPSKLVELFFYDHPTPKERIERAREYSKEK